MATVVINMTSLTLSTTKLSSESTLAGFSKIYLDWLLGNEEVFKLFMFTKLYHQFIQLV